MTLPRPDDSDARSTGGFSPPHNVPGSGASVSAILALCVDRAATGKQARERGRDETRSIHVIEGARYCKRLLHPKRRPISL